MQITDRIRLVISIHAPREGGDSESGRKKTALQNFNPRPPRGGRRRMSSGRIPHCTFQSTPPARGATKAMYDLRDMLCISIHAPREGGDGKGTDHLRKTGHFNPRPPRGGRRWRPRWCVPTCRFQSTPPARGATNAVGGHQLPASDFNPRPPRGGRLPQSLRKCSQRREFQSTPPARGATVQDVHAVDFKIFQSTPPARGATSAKAYTFISPNNFNPRPPRGGRRGHGLI